MACRRSLEYVTALAAIAMALALIAFAISVTNMNRSNRESKENNDANTVVGSSTERKQMENNSETQLLIGTTTTQDLINSTAKPIEVATFLPARNSSDHVAANTASPMPQREENVDSILPTKNSIGIPVTSNNILPVDDDHDVVNNNSHGAFSTTTLASAIDPSLIEVTHKTRLLIYFVFARNVYSFSRNAFIHG